MYRSPLEWLSTNFRKYANPYLKFLYYTLRCISERRWYYAMSTLFYFFHINKYYLFTIFHLYWYLLITIILYYSDYPYVVTHTSKSPLYARFFPLCTHSYSTHTTYIYPIVYILYSIRQHFFRISMFIVKPLRYVENLNSPYRNNE